MRIAVTGATGFIGANLLKALTRQSIEIKALYRPKSAKHRPDLPGISWIKGTIHQDSALETLLNGTDVVIHCAGLIKAKSPKEFFHVNTLGTKNILEVMRKNKFSGTFIFVSSLAARNPQLSPYAKSKMEAENLVKTMCPVPKAIIRPPAVYGPGDKEILPFFKAMEKGWVVIPAPKNNRFSLLHVNDLVDAILELTRCDSMLPEMPLELDDGTPNGYSWAEVIELFEKVKKKRVISITLPPFILKAAGIAGLTVAKILSRPVMITPWKVQELLHPDWVCKNHIKNHQLSWKPQVTLKIALENGLVG